MKEFMNEGNMHTWCKLISDGRTDVHNESWSRPPTVIIENLINKVKTSVPLLIV